MGQLDAGSLKVSARFVGGALTDFVVSLRRPPVARLFGGRSPEDVGRTVPLLFSLCAQAQRAAAVGALGMDAAPVDDRALWSECLHELLWRFLLDWPRALGVPVAAAEFAAWRQTRGSAGLDRASAATVTAALAGGVIARCRALLPGSEPAAAAEELDPVAWLAVADGAPAPAVALPASVAAAYAQRVAALSAALDGLLAGRPYPLARASDGSSGRGIGQVLTARGVLTHAATVVAGRVVDYRIWAPTDRHFGDARGLRQLLAGARWADAGAARHALERAVLALDPCLPYTLELADA